MGFFLILKKIGFIFRERINIQSIQHLHFMTFIFDISLHLEKRRLTLTRHLVEAA